jgi:hypothetical protein
MFSDEEERVQLQKDMFTWIDEEIIKHNDEPGFIYEIPFEFCNRLTDGLASTVAAFRNIDEEEQDEYTIMLRLFTKYDDGGIETEKIIIEEQFYDEFMEKCKIFTIKSAKK